MNKMTTSFLDFLLLNSSIKDVESDSRTILCMANYLVLGGGGGQFFS